MAWFFVLIAGLLEIAWAIGMKQSQGWTRLWPSVWTLAAMGVSFVLLSFAMTRLPVGTAYAVWTGIGAAGTAILGIVIFKEPASAARIACIAVIIAGVLGLRFTAEAEAPKDDAGAAAAAAAATRDSGEEPR